MSPSQNATDRHNEKKRWHFIRTTGNTDGFEVLSKVFYGHDDKYLYERSGKRTPRESSWRTWYDSETTAVGKYFTMIGKSIEVRKREIKNREALYKKLGARLNVLIDAEWGAEPQNHTKTQPEIIP